MSDPWDKLNLGCCGYNSELDRAAIWVLEATASGMNWCDDIAKLTGLDPLLIELLQSVFSSPEEPIFNYGSSPRGAFFESPESADSYIKRWRDYYKTSWDEECPPLPRP